MNDPHEGLVSRTSRRWPAPGLMAVVVAATLLGACDVEDEEGPLVCDDVKVLESADVNGGVTLAKDCYAVEKRLTVSDGVLTLEPGVSIVFSQDAGLEISGNGRLTAKGSAEEQIFLSGTQKQRGFWAGLYFNESKSSANVLDHVVIEYAGSKKWHGGDSKGGVYVRGAGVSLTVTNSVFRENAWAGLYADHGGAEVSVASSLFEKNDKPLWVAANLVGNLAGDNTFSENDQSYVHASVGGTGSGGLDINTPQTWAALSVPYQVHGTITVRAKLELSPGVTIEFEQGKVGFDIGDNGRLSAKGSAEKMITLTGVEKKRGYWKGLYFHDTRSSDNELDYVVVEYAGSDKWHGGDSKGGIYVRDAGVALSVSNSVFRENAWAGIFADNGGAELSVSSSSFEKNEKPLWLASNLVGNLADDNTFSENDGSYVLATTGGGFKVEDDQTWVALSVPYRVRDTIEVTKDLKLSPGVNMEFEQGAGLFIKGGTLSADGSGGERITFGPADGETLRGYWRGISFIASLSSKNVIANADILYGGGGKKWHGGTSQANLFVQGGGSDNSSVSLSDVKIGESGSYGILVESGSSIDPCDDVTFDNNKDGPVGGAGSIACPT